MLYNNNTILSEVFSDRIIDNLFSPLFHGTSDNKKSGYVPFADISEDADVFKVMIDLPGVIKDDIKIQLQNNVLTISGKREFKNDDAAKLLHSETSAGEFSRSFRFTQPVDGEKVVTQLSNGVLTVMLPKHESAKLREITIQ